MSPLLLLIPSLKEEREKKLSLFPIKRNLQSSYNKKTENIYIERRSLNQGM